MYNSTGLTLDQCHALFEKLNNHSEKNAIPPILGLLEALVVTLKYLRRNHVQAELAESHGVSQSTISRAIAAVTTLLANTLEEDIPALADVPTNTALLIDGTILPCHDWADQPSLYSVKHHHTGVNIQVITDTPGRLHWISSPLPGSTYDVTALDTHDILTHLDPTKIIADKGYIGRGLTTPVRTPPRGHLTSDDEEYNRNINHIRWPVEQAIAHLKTWRILSTIHRRPYTTFETTIKTVLGIIFGIL
ncbi:transposase family protein [Arachnia propionica]|uniref:Transposase n=1 Tax=Arachnia propionica TaxID=1750 RepID=A0A3P1WLI1_9ACTN|nr:transposase family protein [Arachnia propionica]RRD46916.1 transposase [Arachnia propionica]